MKNKTKITKIFLVAVFLTVLLTVANFAFAGPPGPYDYQVLENIPGSESEMDQGFVKYVQGIFKFAIWAVGIAAVLMISIGGFMYFTSAGNTSSAEKAKGIIKDALYGVVAVLVAYLVLYTINPDLTEINLKSLKSLTTK